VERVHAFFLLHAVSHTLLENSTLLFAQSEEGRALSITFVLIGAAPFRVHHFSRCYPSSRRVWLTKALGLWTPMESLGSVRVKILQSMLNRANTVRVALTLALFAIRVGAFR